MILTLISPQGERWSAALSEFRADAISALSNDQIKEAQAAINLLTACPIPPPDTAFSVIRKTGWTAMLTNLEKAKA